VHVIDWTTEAVDLFGHAGVALLMLIEEGGGEGVS
jgi:hypothetical protein